MGGTPWLSYARAAMDAELCKKLLEAAAAGDPARLAHAVGAAHPGLKAYVEKLFHGKLAKLAAKKGQTAGDLLGHVEEKILKSPPTGGGGPPAATVMAWVKTTAVHYLIDQTDVADGDARAPDAEMPMRHTLRDPAGGPEALASAANFGRQMRGVIEACYPKGLPVLDILLEAGVADAELAVQLGTSVNNVQAIRRRVRLYCGVCRELLDDAHLADVELAKRCDVRLGEEFAKIAIKVRHFLTASKRGLP